MTDQLTHNKHLFTDILFIGAPLIVGWLTGRYDRVNPPQTQPGFRHPALPASWMNDPWLAFARDLIPAVLFVAAFIMGVRRKYTHLKQAF